MDDTFYSHILELHVGYNLGLKFPLISILYSIDESQIQMLAVN